MGKILAKLSEIDRKLFNMEKVRKHPKKYELQYVEAWHLRDANSGVCSYSIIGVTQMPSFDRKVF